MAESTHCSGTNISGQSSSGKQPSPNIACRSEDQVRSSEGCHIPVDVDEDGEQYIEADGEGLYLSDEDDVIHTVDASEPTTGEVEYDSEPNADDDSELSVLYDPDNPRIELNALFPDVYTFRNGLRHFAIKNQFHYKPLKSDKKRFIAKCENPSCPWRIRASRLRDDNKTFKVTKLPYEHTCPSTSMLDGKMISRSWVAERAANWLRNVPQAGAKQLQVKLQNDHHVRMSYGKAWNGRLAALKKLQGSWENSFQLVYNFKVELEKNCPGSIVEIHCEKDGKMMRFDRMFVALKPCIDGFKAGCRPYLAIDSTHLTGRYRGQLATSCGIDGFNWLYPIAFGVFDLERDDTWLWFMTQLRKAIGDVPGLVISSDCQKGLDKAVAAQFSTVEHRLCMRHLGDNFKKKFHGVAFENNFKLAAKAYTIEDCQVHLEKIKKASEAAFKYLEKKEVWCRCKFSEATKVDYVTNNISESFNNWIKHVKDLHVPELFNQIRKRIMVSFDRRRVVGRKLQGRMVPKVMKELQLKSKSLRGITVDRAGDYCAEVSETRIAGLVTHVVELDKQQCSCREWQISGKPCIHAVAFISNTRNVKLEDYVHEYYSIERFKATYEGMIMPIRDRSQWAKADPGFTVSPPKMKRPAGRPKKERYRGILELGTRKQQCKRCKKFGHQARTCKEGEDGPNRKRYNFYNNSIISVSKRGETLYCLLCKKRGSKSAAQGSENQS